MVGNEGTKVGVLVLVLVLVLEVVGVVEVSSSVVVGMMSGTRGVVVVTLAGCGTVVGDDLVAVLVSGLVSERRAG